MKKQISFSILLLFLSTALFAQQGAGTGIQIKGQVVDSLTNESIPFATLSIAQASSPANPVARMACDEDGVFTATLRTPGAYVFTFQSVARNPVMRTVNIPANRTEVDLGKVLMQDNDQILGEVTVTAQRPLVRIDVDKISYSIEDDPEARTNNVLDMLRKVPMVTVDIDNIQLKGSVNFLIYLNGKPTNMLSGSNAPNVLRGMPASSVKNIEVITDPGSKYDAEGIGGIINIVTASYSALQGYTATLNANAYSYGTVGAGGNVTTKAGKLGLVANYTYRHTNQPWGGYESTREQYGSFANTLKQEGRVEHYYGDSHSGGLEATYEIDTFNLIRVGANLYDSDYDIKRIHHTTLTPQAPNILPYSYDLNTSQWNTRGTFEVNTDFQHSTRKKDELFTFSYRFANSPDNAKTNAWLENVDNYYNNTMYPRNSLNKAYAREHTGQIDYTTPTLKDHTLEAGVKYILRQSRSDTREEIFSEADGKWNPYVRPTDIFDHTQQIYAGYVAYALKYKNFSYKAGVRAEGTWLDAKYENDRDMNFSKDYFNVVPSAVVSYMINMASQIRLGYNVRISRPSIWYLNPYIDNTDSQNISYGNPNLSAETGHNINTNYSLFTPKVNFNASLSYTVVNNSIERYTFINKETGVRELTYENTGQYQNTSLYLYGRWSPVKLMSFQINTGLNYSNFESPALNLANSGFGYNLAGRTQFNLPKEFTIEVMFTITKPSYGLQFERASYTYSTTTLTKTFLNRKLTVALLAETPYVKKVLIKTITTGEDFRLTYTQHNPAQYFVLRASYRFGTLKENIRRVQRGISNDDIKSGGRSD